MRAMLGDAGLGTVRTIPRVSLPHVRERNIPLSGLWTAPRVRSDRPREHHAPATRGRRAPLSQAGWTVGDSGRGVQSASGVALRTAAAPPDRAMGAGAVDAMG